MNSSHEITKIDKMQGASISFKQGTLYLVKFPSTYMFSTGTDTSIDLSAALSSGLSGPVVLQEGLQHADPGLHLIPRESREVIYPLPCVYLKHVREDGPGGGGAFCSHGCIAHTHTLCACVCMSYCHTRATHIIYTHMHAHTHTHDTSACMHTHTHTTHLHACTHTYTHTHAHTHTHTRHICMHTHTYTHTHAHACTVHTQTDRHA